MLIPCPHFNRPAVLLAGLLLVVLGLLATIRPLATSGPAQGASVDIYDRECVFWLDFDDDGEGDTQIDDGPGSYAHQETPVVGSCEFKVNTPVESTLLLDTELREWSSEVEIVSEPGLPERKVLQAGKAEIPSLAGGVKITVEHRGLTPRSGKTRSLKDDYDHEVQVPRPFRLLEITVTTPAGRDDRLEVNSTSASSAYIDAQKRISDRMDGDGTAMPYGIMALAGEMLDEGYPQIADRVLNVEVESGDDGVNWWMVIAIVLAMLLAVAVSVAVMLFLQTQSSDASTGSETPARRPRM